jgi:hypothetical protein
MPVIPAPRDKERNGREKKGRKNRKGREGKGRKKISIVVRKIKYFDLGF